jgi:hypothetical protein
VVVSRHRLMGNALGKNPIGIFFQQRFDQGQAFLPRALGLIGQGTQILLTLHSGCLTLRRSCDSVA